jgi:sugar phosphate isomerase/epimerase
MFHKTQSDPQTIREAIDQAAEVGFEMVIMSFGSGFNYESRDKAYWDRYKELADYGRSKGVAFGAYSLLASRGAGNPKTTRRAARPATA